VSNVACKPKRVAHPWSTLYARKISRKDAHKMLIKLTFEESGQHFCWQGTLVSRNNRQYYKTDMAKVRTSNLFLRPLDLFCYLEKQAIKLNWDKFEQSCTYFFSIIIKRRIFFCFAEIGANFERCGPRWKIIFKFGTLAKKNGNPCYKRLTKFSVDE